MPELAKKTSASAGSSTSSMAAAPDSGKIPFSPFEDNGGFSKAILSLCNLKIGSCFVYTYYLYF